jgi:hypothetical protein
LQPIPLPNYTNVKSGITAFNPQAVPLFEHARWLGNINKLIASLSRRSWRLLLLDDYVENKALCSPEDHPIQAVELGQIQGSINRCDDFERHFYPLHDRTQTRWVRIASMMLQDTSLPPIDLVRVGKIYFVADGHHRVSVARMLDYVSIDANITAAYEA